MSASAPTRIFGIRVGVDPKILAGGLIAIAAVMFWYNSRNDEGGAPTSVQPHSAVAPTASPNRRRPVPRRQSTARDRGVLRLRPVDATSGNVDPTLRLDLLARVQAVPPIKNVRNLFETGPAQPSAEEAKAIHGPTIVPTAVVAPSVGSNTPGPDPMALNIPLKYYGFAQPEAKSERNRGFFLEGDNILVATEGQLLEQRYLVVELTPNSAKLEDTQAKQGQTLALVAEAMP